MLGSIRRGAENGLHFPSSLLFSAAFCVRPRDICMISHHVVWKYRSRYFFGVMPVCLVNTCMKWLWEENAR